MPNTKSMVLVVVLSFLAATLIFSSYSKREVFAEIVGRTCAAPQEHPDGTSTILCCYTKIDRDLKGRIISETGECSECDYDSKGNITTCTIKPRQAGTGEAGINNLPGNLGTVQPPSTPPPASNLTHINNPPGNIGTLQPPSTSPPPTLNAIPPPSALPSPTKQQTLTTTCPNGLLPDANGNCPTTPTTTTNQQGGSTSNNNPQQGHHHKGSNNQPTQTGGGGQETTTTKKHKGSKTDQGTTVQPSS